MPLDRMQQEGQAREGHRIAKRAIAAAALIMAAMGLTLLFGAEAFGIDGATGRLIGGVCLVVGAADLVLLAYWDRLFAR